MTSPPAPAAAEAGVHVATLHCQLTKMPPLEQDVPNSVCVKEGQLPCEESTLDRDDSPSRSQRADRGGLCKTGAGASVCSCVRSPEISLKLCTECSALHNVSCTLFKECIGQSHYIVSPDLTKETTEKLAAIFSQGGSRGGAAPPLAGCSTAASPLFRCDDSGQSPKPIPFHRCCDLAQLDPQVLCLTCRVFHSGSCREKDLCQKTHQSKPLGVCSCGRSTCPRKPLVLCRYCGNEYCRDCWYRNPLVCTCGQTFEQSPV